MWMMGYNDGGADSFNGGRKLRPLMPRLSSPPTAINSDHRFNLVVTMTAEQNKRELMMLNSEPQHPQVMVSSRWNPTPDQLRFLEELYRQGTRTPSADHIQQITAQLRRYGKIEGKNVFYWFQNHKARERQKRRRQMETEQQVHEESALLTNLVTNQRFDKKAPPIEPTKNWLCSVGCDTQPEKPHGQHNHEEPVSVTMVAAKRNGRHGGDESRQSFPVRNATWQMMQLPHGFYPSPHHRRRDLILNSTTVMPTSNSTVPTAKDTVTFSPVFPSKTASKNTETCLRQRCNDNEDPQHDESDNQEQTLELFPLRKEEFCNNGGESEKDKESHELHCFYEFLPLKN